RFADEDAEHQFAADHDVVGSDVLRLLVADQVAERADAADERLTQALFVRAAIGGGDGVAVPGIAAVAPQRPGDRPFDAALAVRKILAAGEKLGGGAFARAELFLQ